MMNAPHHPHKGPFLRAMKPGDQFTGYYILRNKQLEPFRDPARGLFLTLILSDGSGQMRARVWEGGEETYPMLEMRSAVKVQGEVEEFLDRLQIRVFNVRPAEPKEYDLRDMLPSSPRSQKEMLSELQAFIESISHPHLRTLVDHFFSNDEFIRLFSQAPAARRVHHAYLGGLLEHTLELLTIGETVIQLYPHIHGDLLRAGLLLHDIGKVREFTWEMDIDYTDEGRLFGHLTIGDEMLVGAINALDGFPPELAMRLRHMLLAHHGRHEWGSPRRPHTVEAITLHTIENLSAQVNRFHQLLKDLPEGELWSPYDRLLSRPLYAGRDLDLSIEESGLQE